MAGLTTNKCASLGSLVSMWGDTFGPDELVGRYLAEPMLTSSLPKWTFQVHSRRAYIGMCSGVLEDHEDKKNGEMIVIFQWTELD